jgi:magnesium transporter
MPPAHPPDTRPERAQVEHPGLRRADVAGRERNPQEALRHFRELLDRHELEESVVSRQHSHRQDLVQSLVARQQAAEVTRKIARFHPADIAFILEGLPLEQRSRLWHLVPAELDGAVLLEASDAVRESLIADMDRGEILDAAKRMDSDDIADLVPHLPSDVVPELLNALSREDRAQVQSVLSFPEGSVGALMDFDMVSVREDNRIEAVLQYLRRRGRLPHNTHKLMVVDETGVLTGVLFFESLLIHDTERLVREVMDADPVYFRTDDDAREASLAFERYGLVAAPVVNAHRQLVGRLTVDAVMERVVESAQQDLLSQVGLTGDEDLFASIWHSARNRWPWLAVNLMTAFVASRVVGVFEESIEKIVALAALMPIVASIGGNTGNQAVALTIRGLALDQIDRRNARYLLLKELGVSLANGTLWGSVMGAATWLLYGQPLLGLVMAAAMVLNMLLAALIGIGIPLGLGALGRDPAMGSSIILTFATDAGGFFIFLGLASLVLAV